MAEYQYYELDNVFNIQFTCQLPEFQCVGIIADLIGAVFLVVLLIAICGLLLSSFLHPASVRRKMQQ